jgi:transcriptional regulator with XRE-family HTH domain
VSNLVKRYETSWEQATLQKLGDELSGQRKSARFSQAFAAEELDTAESALSRLENGRVNATWLTVCRYARLMGYEVEFKKMDDEDKSTLEKDHAG